MHACLPGFPRNRALATFVALSLAAGAASCADRDPYVPPEVDAGVASALDAGISPDDAGTPVDLEPDGGRRRRDGGARDAGVAVGPDGGVVLPPDVIIVEVLSMTPRRGPATGGTPVRIEGRGFVPGTTATIGGQPLLGIHIDRERTLTGTTPAAPGGAAAVLVSNSAGRAEVPGGFLYEEAPTLVSVAPASGSTAGGTTLALAGAGFTADMAVFVGSRSAFNLLIESSARATVTTPPGAAGRAAVSILNRSGVSTLEDAFTFVAEPALTALSPAFGPAAGGSEVRLIGSGFDQSARVFFGGVAAQASVVSPGELTVITPPSGAAGAVDVSVAADGGNALLRRAYTYVSAGAPLRVQGVLPGFGPRAGGNQVRVVGSGFDRGLAGVQFGGTAATGITVESAGSLLVTVPSGAAGPIDVSVRANDATESVLPAGYIYESGLHITQVLPGRGGAAGGTDVELRGEGFTATTEVYFGPAGAPTVRLADSTRLFVRTPPGPPGEVDVTVRAGDRRATLPRGFLYDQPPQLLRLTPSRGAIAGGTFVRLLGAGFTPSTRVLVNGVHASEVSFVHSGLVTARTPAGVVGPADVVAGTPHGGAILEAGFTYFDPSTRFGGTSGGPVDGAVNVTVLNGTNGRPVPAALVTLATDGISLYQGITNANGQVVFSGPDLRGRQTVTATKESWSTYSIVQFDAQNVTMYLSPLTGSFGPGPPGVEQPKIRGIIRSAFKPIPAPPDGWRLAVMVTTSQQDRYRAEYIGAGYIEVLYDDGREDRPYEISARYGDQAVYALGGHLKNDGSSFIPFVLGLHRYISIPAGVLLADGKDVRIDADLNATLDVRLLQAPPLGQQGPHVYRMRVWVDLGVEGVLTFFQIPQSTSEPRLVQEKLPQMGGALQNASVYAAVGAYTLTQGYETLPLSEATVERITNLREPVEIGPLMDLARAAHPLPGEVQPDRRFAWDLRTPPEASYFQLYLPQRVGDYNSTVWTAIVPGHLREMVVPDLAQVLGVGGLPVASTTDWYIIASRSRRFDIDGYDSRDLYDRLAYSFIRHTFERP